MIVDFFVLRINLLERLLIPCLLPDCLNFILIANAEVTDGRLSPEELKNPKSTISDSIPVLRNTKHYYIKLNEFEDFLRGWITVDNKDIWKANVIGQVKSWLDNGLKPRAVTRDLDWGIPIEVDGDDGKVLYVWFEAPIGYISSTKEWALKNNKDWETSDLIRNKLSKLGVQLKDSKDGTQWSK